ncbi:hypothetical protein EC957_007083, partial [Mortierella hygrophila]
PTPYQPQNHLPHQRSQPQHCSDINTNTKYAAITQPIGRVQYLPRSEDENNTSGETHEDAELTSNSMDDQQPQTKEIEKKSSSTPASRRSSSRLLIFWTDDPGTTGNITNGLAYKLGGLVTFIGKNLLFRFLQIDSRTTEKYLSV